MEEVVTSGGLLLSSMLFWTLLYFSWIGVCLGGSLPLHKGKTQDVIGAEPWCRVCGLSAFLFKHCFEDLHFLSSLFPLVTCWCEVFVAIWFKMVIEFKWNR